MLRNRLGIIAFALVLTLLAPVPGGARQEKIAEYQVKAAFLYNFTKFIDWPGQAPDYPKNPFVIEIIGKNPFGGALKPLESLKIRRQPVKIVYADKPERLKPCRLLFISRAAEDSLADILEKVNGTDTLTVSDIPGFAKKGGMIEFIIEHGRIGFRVNLKVAQAAGLEINYQLLKVAKEIIRE